MSIVVGCVEIYFKKLSDQAIIPNYKHEGDSGMDLHAEEDTMIEYGKISVVRTGLAAEVITRGDLTAFTFEVQVRPRSGLAMTHGITIVNTPVTIDNGYRGPWKFPLTKLTEGAYKIMKGERFAQAVICPVFTAPMVSIQQKEELNSSSRGEKGFGSTGRR